MEEVLKERPKQLKSPPTLQEQSKRVVVTLVLRATCKMQKKKSSLDICEWVKEGQDYLLQATHLFNDIAIEVMKWKPMNLYLFLVPQLKVLEISGNTLQDVIHYKANLPVLEELYLFIEISVFNHIDRLFYSMVGTFSNLRKLKLFNCCTDTLLAVVGANCRFLQVFDAEDDNEFEISNLGLSYLANCKELTHVILNDTGDEYDYEDRYFNITEKGIASFLLALPKLQVFVCEPSLLRGALAFLSFVAPSTKIQLKYFRDTGIMNSTVYILQTMAPAITTLVLEDPVLANVGALSQFVHLRKLVLKYFTWDITQEEKYFQLFSQLDSLTLHTFHQANVVTESLILSLGHSCQKLTELKIILNSGDNVAKVTFLKHTKSEFFPKLTSLNLSGKISTNMIDLFLKSVSNLTQLGICFSVGRDNFSDSQLDPCLTTALKSGNLRKLEVLNIFQWNVRVETILCFIEECPNLRDIWGLDLSMMSSTEIAIFKERIRGCNLAVEIHYGNAPDNTSCLYFLHQVHKRLSFVENLLTMKEWRAMLNKR